MCDKCNGGCNTCNCTCKVKKPCEDPCQEQNCGCDFLIPTDCVITEENYDCIGSIAGEKLKVVLHKIDEKLCDYSEPEDGLSGDSAYTIWLNLGNEGSEQDFIDSLIPECSCGPQEVYTKEEESILNTLTGSWPVLMLGSEIGITPIGFEYIVPIGEDGVYDLEFQCTVAATEGDINFVAGLYINSSIISNGRTASFAAIKQKFNNIYLVCKNVTVVAGDVLDLKLASSGNTGVFLQNKFIVTKK